MRLFEIDDMDRTFAAAAQVDLDVDERFEYGVFILTTLLRSNSPLRNSRYLAEVESIEYDFQWILKQSFANDSSTTEIKEKTSKYLQEIQRLKGLL